MPQAKGNPNKINPALGVITTQEQLDQFFGNAYQISGPIWSGPMHDISFVRRVLNHVSSLEGEARARVNVWPRIHGVFTAVSEELQDVPLYYPISSMVRLLHVRAKHAHAHAQRATVCDFVLGYNYIVRAVPLMCRQIPCIVSIPSFGE